MMHCFRFWTKVVEPSSSDDTEASETSHSDFVFRLLPPMGLVSRLMDVVASIHWEWPIPISLRVILLALLLFLLVTVN